MNCTRGASGAVRGLETWSVPRSQPLRAPRGPCFFQGTSLPTTLQQPDSTKNKIMITEATLRTRL